MRCFCPRRFLSTRVYTRNKRWGIVHIKRKDPGKSEGSTNQSCAVGLWVWPSVAPQTVFQMYQRNKQVE